MAGKGSDSDSTSMASAKGVKGRKNGRRGDKEKTNSEEDHLAMAVDESDDEETNKNNGDKRHNNKSNAMETTDNDEDEEGEDDDREDEEDDEDEDDESSSDMDVQECEKKRVDCIDDLADLEKQFSILREQLYRERMTQISAKLAEVRSGKASEYLQPLEELQANMRTRMEVASVLKHLRIQNIECKSDAEILAAEQNFESEKELLWDQLKADLEDKIHRLEEDKHNVDLSLWDPCDGSSASKHRRRLKGSSFDELDRRKKPVSVVGPYLVYMIKDAEIMEDWAIIKRSLSHQQRQHKRGEAKAS